MRFPDGKPAKILLAFAAVTALSLLLHVSQLGRLPLLAPLALWGYMLDRLFPIGAWFIPGFLGGMAYLSTWPGAGWLHLGLALATWIPLLTLVVFYRALEGNQAVPLVAFLLERFGHGGSIFLSGFFLAAQVVGAALWFVTLRGGPTNQEQEIAQGATGTSEDPGRLTQETSRTLSDTVEVEGPFSERDFDIRHDPFFDEPVDVHVPEAPPQEDAADAAVGHEAPSTVHALDQEGGQGEGKELLVVDWDRLGRFGRTPHAASESLKLAAEVEDPAVANLTAIFEEVGERDPTRSQPPERSHPSQPQVLQRVSPGQAEPPRRSSSRSTTVSAGGYKLDLRPILKATTAPAPTESREKIEHNSTLLEKTLAEFNIEARVVGVKQGPVVTLYEILPAPGVKLSRIVTLADNIALVLACGSVRIVAPIPGKHAVGVEVPNERRQLVSFGELVLSETFQEAPYALPIALGKDISGELQVVDLTRTPHLLIAGATGSGKSVMVNSLICSLLCRPPQDVKLLLVDPKIVELKFFNDIPHLLTPVITEPRKALMAAQWCLSEMERRYTLLDAQGVRDIRSYNQRIEKKQGPQERLPYIVFIIDEFADLMASSGKELEGIIARLAAMSRAVGIHLVLATQRPSIDVITGLIKANFPSRIAFMVASKTDSRIILDQVGAENLLGKGDMLFSSAWEPFPKRIQAPYLSEEDVENIVAEVKKWGPPQYITDEILWEEEEDEDIGESALDDPLWKRAVEIVTTSRKASASYLQRRMSIGYNRAARLIEEMERQGIVGPSNGSKPRQIMVGDLSSTAARR